MARLGAHLGAHLIGISGSLRRESLNSSLLRAAIGSMPAGSEMEMASIAGIPLYDGDVESEQGIPVSVATLKDRIAAADGLLLVTPEYNNSLPGVLKNAVDWLTRPAEDIPKVFGGLPVAVIGASPGGFGTILAQEAWLPVLRTLRVRPWFDGRLMVSRANAVFDASGALTDDKIRDQLGKFMAGFAAFASLNSRRH